MGMVYEERWWITDFVKVVLHYGLTLIILIPVIVIFFISKISYT